MSVLFKSHFQISFVAMLPISNNMMDADFRIRYNDPYQEEEEVNEMEHITEQALHKDSESFQTLKWIEDTVLMRQCQRAMEKHRTRIVQQCESFFKTSTFRCFLLGSFGFLWYMW